MGAIAITPWEATDRAVLEPLVRDYLATDGDFLPDDHNVGAFTDLGMQWAEAGEPCLVAREDGEIVGFTLWGPVRSPLHLKAKICHGLIHYVLPSHRRRRVATELAARAYAMARTKGYQRVDAIANATSHAVFARVGCQPAGTLMKGAL
jgi:GNAT superfamily N-acetyltransferase